MAVSLYYEPVVNSQYKRVGIGLRMPSATELIKLMLNEEESYRLLSAVAHGHSWAIRQLAFKAKGDDGRDLSAGGVPVSNFEKTVRVDYLAYLGLVAANAWAKPLWHQCLYFAWDKDRLTALLDSTFDKLHAAPGVRFWRGTSS